MGGMFSCLLIPLIIISKTMQIRGEINRRGCLTEFNRVADSANTIGHD